MVRAQMFSIIKQKYLIMYQYIQTRKVLISEQGTEQSNIQHVSFHLVLVLVKVLQILIYHNEQWTNLHETGHTSTAYKFINRIVRFKNIRDHGMLPSTRFRALGFPKEPMRKSFSFSQNIIIMTHCLES